MLTTRFPLQDVDRNKRRLQTEQIRSFVKRSQTHHHSGKTLSSAPSLTSSSSMSLSSTSTRPSSITMSPDGVQYLPSTFWEQNSDFVTIYEVHDIEENRLLHTEPKALFQHPNTDQVKKKKIHVLHLPNQHHDTQMQSENNTILGASVAAIRTNKIQLENNVHQKSVVRSKRVKYASKELDENEVYANQVGLHFSSDRGDFFTFPDTHLIACPEPISELSSTTVSSPHHGKIDQGLTCHNMFGDIHQLDTLASSPPPPSSILCKKSRFQKKSQQSPVSHQLITPQTRKNMVENDDDLKRLRKRAALLCVDWASPKYLTPIVARRLRDFEFAQEKRRKIYGDRFVKWGVLGLYDFVTAVRTDIEWAEDAGNRRAMGLPYKPWLEFVKNKETGSNRPFLTYFIITSTTVCFIASVGLNQWRIDPLRINPMIGPSVETLVKMGAKDSDLIVNKVEWWRLISTTFLHAGLIHYLMNCFAIYYVCRPVEQNHGSKATAFIFLISSIGANVFSATFMPEYVTVGASGGIFGLMGCCVADIILNRRVIFSEFVNKGKRRIHHIWVIITLFLDLAINVLIGLTPMIDNFTHLGGLLLGFLSGLCLMDTMIFDQNKKRCVLFCKSEKISFVQMVTFLSSTAILVACTTALYMGDGVNSPCPQCEVLSCVPFPWWSSNKWYTCDYDKCNRAIVRGVTLNGSGNITSVDMTCPNHQQATYYVDASTTNIENWLQDSYINICRKICKK